MTETSIIPVFFATDENYVPYLGVSSGKSLHFGYADEVEVAGNSVLECRCSYCKLERLTLGRHCEKTVNKTT